MQKTYSMFMFTVCKITHNTKDIFLILYFTRSWRGKQNKNKTEVWTLFELCVKEQKKRVHL